MAYDLKAKIAEAAKTGPNMTEANAGGGDYTPPAQGIAQARFVAYLELGIHEENDFNNPGQKKDKKKVDLVFELSGPNHAPRKLDDGTLVPIRIMINENLALGDKANFFKIFAAMNYAGKATHMAELLGEAFLVSVYHKKSKDGKKTYATLKGSNDTLPVGDGYRITGPQYDDPMSGKRVPVAVAPAITDLKAFIWENADKEMWDSLYIEGEYPERKDEKTGAVTSPAKSKNVIQNKIRSAKNWGTHSLSAIVAAGGAQPDLPDAENPDRLPGEDDEAPWTDAAADPLAAIG
jgi:hypothetical protein